MARARLEPIGLRFGALIVIGEEPHLPDRKVLCRCDCGTCREFFLKNLVNGHSSSCGCLVSQKTALRTEAHGHARKDHRTREYQTWSSMRSRVLRPTDDNYPLYGARGISICSRWLVGEGSLGGFECFLADMGPRPQGHSLDRIDGEGGYEPGNCRWATPSVQGRNIRTVRKITFNGATKTTFEWAEVTGVPGPVIGRRVRVGWDVERALYTPVAARSPRKKSTRRPPLDIRVVGECRSA